MSAQQISKATVDFFNHLHHQAHNVMTTFEDGQTEKSRKLAAFEKLFKEEAAREEKQALENIAIILANLTSKKTALVMEASKNVHDLDIQENKKLQQQMLSMQQISTDAKEELCNYVAKTEKRFIENTFSLAESRAMIESSLQECSNNIDHSRQQWQNTQSHINILNKSCTRELLATIEEKIGANQTINEQFLSAFSSMDAEFDDSICDLQEAVNDCLMLDHESKKQADCTTTLCLDQLKYLQENHGQNVASIRTEAERCLVKNYLVDLHKDTTPTKRVISVPSLASIDKMRTPIFENLKEENRSINRSKWFQNEAKMQQVLNTAASPHRTPFSDVN